MYRFTESVRVRIDEARAEKMSVQRGVVSNRRRGAPSEHARYPTAFHCHVDWLLH